MADNNEVINKREAILYSAYQVFTEKGFHVAKVSDVAELAKVGKGTVYEYFASKEDLLRGVIEEGIKYYINELKQQVNTAKTPWEKIKNLIRKHGELLRKDHKMAQLTFENFGVMTQEFHEFLVEQRQGIITMIQGILEEGMKQGQIQSVSLEVGARMVLGLMLSIHCEDQCLPEQSVEEMLTAIEKGLLKSY